MSFAREVKINIGNNVFVGSDTMMVVPVPTGDGALQSVRGITKGMYQQMRRTRAPPEQKIVEGYAAQRRHKLEKED